MKRFVIFALLAISLQLAIATGIRAQTDQPGTMKYETAIDTPDSLFRVADSPRSQVTAAITTSSTSVNVTTTAAFPVSGSIKIDNEVLYYTGKTSSSFTGLTRGQSSTTPAAHSAGAIIFSPILARHHNVLAEAIIALEGKVGVGSSPASDAPTGAVLRKNGDGSTGWSTDAPPKVPITRTVNGYSLGSDVTVTKSDVGLGNVANLDQTNPANIAQDSTHRFATDAEKSTWNGKQDADADLATFAGLTPANDDFLQRKAGAWVNRTVAQVKSDLALNNVPNVDATNASNISSGTLNAARLPYLVYVATLTQSGTSAPVATVLQNTLGGSIVWTRSAMGDYIGTLSAAFTANKTVIILGPAKIEDATSQVDIVRASRASAGAIEINTSILDVDGGFNSSHYVDDLLVETAIEIRVYP